jgi:hypothetical protein
MCDADNATPTEQLPLLHAALDAGASVAIGSRALTWFTIGGPVEVHASFSRFILEDDYLAIAEQSPLSSYSFNYTAVAASVKLSAPTTDPIR